MSSLSGGSIPVYTGVWVNWSRGRIHGSTLTLTQRDGATLTAFVALFVAYTGTMVWKLICFGLHNLKSSKGLPMFGPYHQRQSVLRNSPTAGEVLSQFVMLSTAWRRYGQKSSAHAQLVPFILLSFICTTCFTTAGIFSSQVSSTMGDEVLISSPACGRPLILPGIDTKGQPVYSTRSQYSLDRISRSRDYALTCYNQENGSACRTFVKPQIPFFVSKNATCPFDSTVCKLEHQNILLDSRVNARNDLGINLKENENLDLRWLTHCGPLKTEAYKKAFTYSATTSYTQYLYGPYLQMQYDPVMAEFENLQIKSNHTLVAKTQDFEEYKSVSGVKPSPGRQITVVPYASFNGSFSYATTSFMPLDTIKPRDGEVHVVFLTNNFKRVVDSVDDPWYLAHKMIGEIPDPDGGRMAMYAADEASQNSELLLRIFQTWAAYSVADLVNWAGVTALTTESSGDVIDQSVSSDTWQSDVIFWQQQFLASLQGSAIDAATGPLSVD